MATVIYAPILGQSNADNLMNFYGDDEAGYTELEQTLTNLTGLQTVSAFHDSEGDPISLAVGGSTVDGNNTHMSDDRIWWYPDTNEAGGALLNAVALLQSQYASLTASGNDVVIEMIWAQGEHNAKIIAEADDADIATQRYFDATRAVFDYIKNALGVDVNFHMIQTGFMHEQGALNEGLTQEQIDANNMGAARVRQEQENLASQYSDIYLATNYDDLPTRYDDGDLDDKWHLAGESYEIVGQRVAQSVYDSVIAAEFPRLDGTSQAEQIHGGEENELIFGYEGIDRIFGNEGDDTIMGGADRDVLNGGDGGDHFVYEAISDSVRGEPGNRGYDRIEDFEVGVDKIDVSQLGFSGIVVSGSTEFGELRARYSENSDRTYIRDYNGSDFELILEGNYLTTLTANDFIFAAAPSTVQGTVADETLQGGDGIDVIIGGGGQDKLTGGGGRDFFTYLDVMDSLRGLPGNRTYDRITDFEDGLDKIDLSGLGFHAVTSGSTDPGELRIKYSSGSDRTYVRDDHGSDFELFLEGDYTALLGNEDFIFG